MTSLDTSKACATSGSVRTSGNTATAEATPAASAVMVDLTPVIDGHGLARLSGKAPGGSGAAFKTWLERQGPNLRSLIQRIALERFAGCRRAGTDAIPPAHTVMVPRACRAPRSAGVEPVPPAGRASNPDAHPRVAPATQPSAEELVGAIWQEHRQTERSRIDIFRTAHGREVLKLRTVAPNSLLIVR